MRRSVVPGRPAIGLLRMCRSDEAYASSARLTSEGSLRRSRRKTKSQFGTVRAAACVYNVKSRSFAGLGALKMVTLQSIKAAAGRIRDSIFLSPFVRSETFSKLTDNSIFFKLENLQMTGSYKERGALNKILLLTSDERRRGVIAASAGNHAQAVAYHAAKRGISAQICMPLTTPLVKVSATRGYGAEVILAGRELR